MKTIFATDVRSILRISFPLMLTALSHNLMMLVDRFVLARYSLEAMNAAVTVTMAANIVQYAGIAIASIAEVLVGQYNGAGRQRDIGRVVWQMLWFTVALFAFSVPLAFWGEHWLIPAAQQKVALPYYTLIMLFAPLGGMFAALSSAFIGLGRTAIVTWTVVAANVVNLLLNVLLVFGVDGWFGPLGVPGAAIATVTTQLLQIGFLLFCFLRKPFREKFGTGKFRIHKETLWACLRLGIPSSAGHMIEVAAWAFLFQMVAGKGADYLTVLTIGESLFMLFTFVNEGLYKGVVAIAANLMGAQRQKEISKLCISAFKAYSSILLVLAIPLVFWPGQVLACLVSQSDALQFATGLRHEITNTLLLVWVYALIDGIVWSLAAILTAAGDTRFIMVANAVNAWFGVVMPIWFFLPYAFAPASVWLVYLAYASINLVVFLMRYRYGAWISLAKGLRMAGRPAQI